LLVLAENKSKNSFVNLSPGCVCSVEVQNSAIGMFMFWVHHAGP